MADLKARLIVALVQDSIDRGTAREEKGPNPSRNAIQTVALLEAIDPTVRTAAYVALRQLAQAAAAMAVAVEPDADEARITAAAGALMRNA